MPLQNDYLARLPLVFEDTPFILLDGEKREMLLQTVIRLRSKDLRRLHELHQIRLSESDELYRSIVAAMGISWHRDRLEFLNRLYSSAFEGDVFITDGMPDGLYFHVINIIRAFGSGYTRPFFLAKPSPTEVEAMALWNEGEMLRFRAQTEEHGEVEVSLDLGDQELFSRRLSSEVLDEIAKTPLICELIPEETQEPELIRMTNPEDAPIRQARFIAFALPEIQRH